MNKNKPKAPAGTTATGSCLCGEVQYYVNGPMGSDVHPCHCSQCRKQSGHFAAYIPVDNWDDVVIQGANNVTWYRASDTARRGFCKICGSQLFWVPEGGERISGDVTGGTLDTAPRNLHVESHIFVADKGKYYEITDPVERHAKYPEDL